MIFVVRVLERVLNLAEKKDWSCSGIKSLAMVQRSKAVAAAEATVEITAFVGTKLRFSPLNVTIFGWISRVLVGFTDEIYFVDIFMVAVV